MFTLEYSQWFDFLLPGLDRLKMPIPLGGTSNHFRLTVLRKVRAWDPYNVTEDADLGIRLAQEGYTDRRHQLDHLRGGERRPAELDQAALALDQGLHADLARPYAPPDRAVAQAIGWRGIFSFHFFIGAPPLPACCVNPILWAITIAFYLLGDSELRLALPRADRHAGDLQPLLRQPVPVYFGVVAALKRRYLDLVPAGMLQPLYWVLHSIAAYKALWQLIANPHYWEKTEHGTSSVTDRKLAVIRKEAA